MLENPKLDLFSEVVSEKEKKNGKTVTMGVEDARQLLDEVYEIRRVAWRAEVMEGKYAKFGKFLADREKEENGWIRSNDEIERVSDLIVRYEHGRNSAYNFVGSFLEHAVISLRAIQMVLKQCHGLTHRQIDSRLDVAEGTVQEAINVMLSDRSNNWEYMETDLFGRKDWDFRKLAAENAKLRRELEEARKDKS